MENSASQFDMSLNSVVSLIKEISTSNESISKVITGWDKSNFIEKIKPSDFNASKTLIKIKNYAQIQYMKLSQISNILTGLSDGLLLAKDQAAKTINVNINGKAKDVDATLKVLENLNSLVTIDNKKLDDLSRFLGGISNDFVSIGKYSKDAALGLGLFTGSLLILSMVSFLGIMKFGFMLATLGVSIAFFLFTITTAFKGTDAIKTFLILKMLPGVFTSLGRGVIMLAAGLLIFEMVNPKNILTLVATVGALLGLFALFSNNQRKSLMGNVSIKSAFANRINKETSPIANMLKFSFALGLIVLALNAVKSINFSAIVNLTLTIGILIMVTKLDFKGGKIGSPKFSGMFRFATGLGVLILALHAVEEVKFSSIFKLLTFIAGLGLALRTFKLVPKMMKFSFGFGIMVLAMYAMREIKYETMLKTLGFIAGLGLALKLFSSTKGAISMILLSGSLIVFAFAMGMFTKLNISFMDILTMGAAIITMATIVGVIGIFSIPIIIGAVTLGILSSALLVGAMGFGAIGNINISYVNILKFIGAVLFTAIALTLLTPILLISLPASLMLIPLAGALFLAGTAFGLMSKNKIDFETITNFAKSIGVLSLTLAALFFPILLATPAAILLIPIMVSILITAEAFQQITKHKFKSADLSVFMRGVDKIISGINNFGFISLGKAAAKSLLLLPIFFTMLTGAKMMKNIQEVELDKSKLEAFNVMVDDITKNIVNVVDKNSDKLADVAPGLESLSKIFNVGGNIAQVVRNMADLSYDEYRVRNGKLVLYKRHKLTTEDFNAAGKNLGIIINELVKPLNVLGSDSGTFSIGGYLIDNPFKSGNKNKGMAFIAKIGNAYLPLSESLNKLTKSGLLTEDKLVNKMSVNLPKVINTYVKSLQDASKLDINKSEKALKQMLDLNELFKNGEIESVNEMSLSFERIVNVFSDDKKWKSIRKNLTFMREEFKGIAKVLNSIDIEKTTAFENSLKIIAESNRSDVQELIAKLSEFILALSSNQSNPTQIVQTSQTAPITQSSNNTTINNKATDNTEMLTKSFEDLMNGISNVADILQNETLEVKVKNFTNRSGIV